MPTTKLIAQIWVNTVYCVFSVFWSFNRDKRGSHCAYNWAYSSHKHNIGQHGVLCFSVFRSFIRWFIAYYRTYSSHQYNMGQHGVLCFSIFWCLIMPSYNTGSHRAIRFSVITNKWGKNIVQQFIPRQRTRYRKSKNWNKGILRNKEINAYEENREHRYRQLAYPPIPK